MSQSHFTLTLDMMGEPFRAISDANNWQTGHFPCPLSRVIFPETANILIDTTLKASQVILPKNGAIVFTADGSIEMEERMSDLESTVSCAFGQDAFFIGNLHHSHDSPGSVVSWLLRLLVDVIAIVTIMGIAYGVYLHRTQGYTASQVIHHLYQRATARLTVTNVSPLQGTFNFVRFHGDEGHLEMEMGNASESPTRNVTSDISYISLITHQQQQQQPQQQAETVTETAKSDE